MTEEPILRLEGAAVGYGRQAVLSEITLSIPHGEFVGLLGANGSGKTTLLKTILGILPPLRGKLVFQPVQGHPPFLGYVPQREAIDPIFPLSAFEVVLMGAAGRLPPGRRIGCAEKDWTDQCLAQTGVGDLRRERFSHLSGGQKQRVLIARALATRPDILLLDEPTAGIDAAATRVLLTLLRRIHEELRMTLVMASHDLSSVRECVRQVIWLRQGEILMGNVSALLSQQRMAEILRRELA